MYVEVQRLDELTRPERGEQSRSDGVVEHGRMEGAQHLAHWIGEGRGGLERHSDLVGRCIDTESQSRSRRRHGHAALDAIPEWSDAYAGGFGLVPCHGASPLNLWRIWSGWLGPGGEWWPDESGRALGLR